MRGWKVVFWNKTDDGLVSILCTFVHALSSLGPPPFPAVRGPALAIMSPVAMGFPLFLPGGNYFP